LIPSAGGKKEGIMRGLAVLAGLLVPVFLFSGAVENSAMAQEKAKAQKAAGQVTLKEVTKNEKVRVYEAIFKPGDEAPSIERPFRVIRALRGGTLQLTYPDGKKETSRYKNGEVKIRDRATYAVKNIGKTTVHLYVVQPM
jgi:hypothetical protein